MAKRGESRLRRPTSKLKPGEPSEPLKPKRRRRTGAVHPNSMAARKMGRQSWTYVGDDTPRPLGGIAFAKRVQLEEQLRLERAVNPPTILPETDRERRAREWREANPDRVGRRRGST